MAQTHLIAWLPEILDRVGFNQFGQRASKLYGRLLLQLFAWRNRWIELVFLQIELFDGTGSIPLLHLQMVIVDGLEVFEAHSLYI
jgi:hypothetical protein